jgi:drug/metabolite transporter (DMT)-like permease
MVFDTDSGIDDAIVWKGGHAMHKSLVFWVIWFVFLFILDFCIPFFVLTDIPTLKGSFLFWIVWIVVAIVSMFIMFLNWQENEEQNSRG